MNYVAIKLFVCLSVLNDYYFLMDIYAIASLFSSALTAKTTEITEIIEAEP